jgi:hypothetical protein
LRLFDCFTFFNELDLLELRLRSLHDTVDHFVLAEAPVTFQGQPKPLFYKENERRFRPFAKKIIHVVVDDMPAGGDHWGREYHQRNALKRGLQNAAPDDYVLVSDVDELISKEAIAAASAHDALSFFEQRLAVYFLDWEVVGRPDGLWTKAYGAPKRLIDQIENLSTPREQCPAYFRSIGQPFDNPVIPGAGWHFSWMGGVDSMLRKINAIADTAEGLQVWKSPARLREAIASKTFFAEGARLVSVGLEDLPPVVQDNKNQLRLKNMLSDEVSLNLKDRFRRKLRKFAARLFPGG